VGWATRMVDP